MKQPVSIILAVCLLLVTAGGLSRNTKLVSMESTLPGFVTITQMPTKLYTYGQEEPSLKGLELTLHSGGFTRSVRYNDLKRLHKSWAYMYEPGAPEPGLK